MMDPWFEQFFSKDQLVRDIDDLYPKDKGVKVLEELRWEKDYEDKNLTRYQLIGKEDPPDSGNFSYLEVSFKRKGTGFVTRFEIVTDRFGQNIEMDAERHVVENTGKQTFPIRPSKPLSGLVDPYFKTFFAAGKMVGDIKDLHLKDNGVRLLEKREWRTEAEGREYQLDGLGDPEANFMSAYFEPDGSYIHLQIGAGKYAQDIEMDADGTVTENSGKVSRD